MLFSVHLTVILRAFLKVITGFFTIFSLFNFQGPTHFQGLFAFFIWSCSPQQCEIYYTTSFWVCQAFFKSFLKTFSSFSNQNWVTLLITSWPPTLHFRAFWQSFIACVFLSSAVPLSATVDIISALPAFVNPFLTIFLSFLHYWQIPYFKLTCL